MPRRVAIFALGLLVLGTSGCGIHLARTPPPPPKPLREISREEKGQVINVRDTKLDLSTGRQAPLATSAPVGIGPFGVPIPITIGGEKKKEVPAEEITIQLANGRLIAVVQELSSPPFAPGERVRVQYEAVDDPGTTPRMKVVRDL